MIEYIIEVKQPSHGTAFYRSGHGIYEKDQNKATRFNSHYQAMRHLTGVLADVVLRESVEICIVPARSEEPWTVEEILAREG